MGSKRTTPPPPSNGRRPHPQYWEVKAAELEFLLGRQATAAQLEQQVRAEYAQRLETALQPGIAKRAAVWRAAGLDSTKNYQLDDTTQTIVELPAPNGATKSPP